MVFDGEELLEFAAKSVRNEVDFLSVTYQTTSYFGNQAGPDLVPTLERLRASGLIDRLIFYEPDLSIHHKENELRLRNLGLEASREAGCTHHCSSDVDEFCLSNELAYVKKTLGDVDFAVIPQVFYYKHPTWRINPDQGLFITFIHSVENEYVMDMDFPFKVEITRRFRKYDSWKVFSRDEITLHHMSYVRKDIRKKLANSDNGQFYSRQFFRDFDKHQLGDRVCILPDYLYRRTVLTENIFGIKI